MQILFACLSIIENLSLLQRNRIYLPQQKSNPSFYFSPSAQKQILKKNYAYTLCVVEDESHYFVFGAVSILLTG